VAVLIAVVTPVGPGHEPYVHEAVTSVQFAWNRNHGEFSSLVHDVIDDTRGELGRSRARNQGIDRNDTADWFFFLDADDLMHPDGFAGCARRGEACALVFGAVCTEAHGILRENVHPLDWSGLMRYGAVGTLSMGCFVRADVARLVRFDENRDAGEDFDFYLRACSEYPWVKRSQPLVTIRTGIPSAGGPRGYDALDWRGVCEDVVAPWRGD